MVKGGQEWFGLVGSGSEWSGVVKGGQEWLKVVFGVIRSRQESSRVVAWCDFLSVVARQERPEGPHGATTRTAHRQRAKP